MKHFYVIVMLTVLTFALNGCKPKTTPAEAAEQRTMVDVGVDEFEKMIADTSEVTLLDVRSMREYQEGHLKGAILIDMKEHTFHTQSASSLPYHKEVAVYCRTGFRSKTAGKILMEEGFDVIHLKGGYRAWTDAGKPVEK